MKICGINGRGQEGNPNENIRVLFILRLTLFWGRPPGIDESYMKSNNLRVGFYEFSFTARYQWLLVSSYIALKNVANSVTQDNIVNEEPGLKSD